MIGIVFIIWTIIALLKRKKLKVPLVGIGICVGCLIISVLIGTFSWTKTSSYQEFLDEKEQQKQLLAEETDVIEAPPETELTDNIEIETESDGEFEPESEPESEEFKSAESEKTLSSYFEDDMCDKIMSLLENDIGFDGISFVEKDSSLEIYYFTVDGYNIAVTAYSDDGVYNVYVKNNMNYMFYDIDEGIEMTYAEFKDKVITPSERTYYYLMAKEAVKSVLVSPSSAKFASESEMVYGKKGDIVAVQGTVTAKNQLGVKIESNFTIEIQVYDMATYSYGVLYLKLDDEVSGEWVDID
jgi:hypothetical protein